MSPPLTAAQIELVYESFDKVAAIAEQASEQFYGRLFELAPEVRPMFKGDMESQGRKLMTTLALVVGSLNDFSSVVPTVEALAVKHVSYGVEPAHYGQVGEALLCTFEKCLGPDFTPEVKAAWAQVYAILSGTMIAAAYGSKAPA